MSKATWTLLLHATMGIGLGAFMADELAKRRAAARLAVDPEVAANLESVLLDEGESALKQVLTVSSLVGVVALVASGALE